MTDCANNLDTTYAVYYAYLPVLGKPWQLRGGGVAFRQCI